MNGFTLTPHVPGALMPHRIICRSGWAGCQGWHPSAALVRECCLAKRDGAWPYSWLLEGRDEDGICVFPCNAPARCTEGTTDGSYKCLAGHCFIPDQTLAAQGMAYAADEGEARGLAQAGVQPLTMTGQVWPW
jgi:hypothetical protein